MDIDMARYRKIDTRIWNDAKFSKLSNGAKLLFMYLLTSPQTQQIGAVPLRAESVAAELNLDMKQYQIQYDELYQMGIVEYDERGLFWVKNFLKYNAPDNPKVVISWRTGLDYLPECPLLKKIIESAQAHCLSRGERYAEAFRIAIGDCIEYGIDDGIGMGMANQRTENREYIDKLLKEKNTKKESPKTETEKAKKTRNAPLKKPDDVQSEQVWEDFLQIRKAKHAPLTETALAGIRREAEKAGISLEAALQTCCERGWQGFKADWYRKESYNGYSVNRKSEMPFPSDVSDFTGKPLVEPM